MDNMVMNWLLDVGVYRLVEKEGDPTIFDRLEHRRSKVVLVGVSFLR